MGTILSRLRKYAFLCLCALIGCGKPPTPQPPGKLKFAYFGSLDNQLAETRDHVNLYMVPWWLPDMAAEAQRAAALGLPVVLMPRNEISMEELRVLLDSLGSARSSVVALYWDEPDANPHPDFGIVRILLVAYPELRGCKIAASLTGNGLSGDFSAIDIVGVSAYGDGQDALTKSVKTLRDRLAPHQSMMVIPYGATPWLNDPMPFVDYALADDRVVWVIAFRYFDGEEGPGIRNNGQALRYKMAGLRAIQ